MTRQMLQIRPRGTPDAPTYSPQRDLVNLYPHAMREAVSGLDKIHWQEYFAGWVEATTTTQDDLAEGIRLFVEAQHLFTGDPTIQEPADAFERVGFFKLPHPVRIMVYERLGEVMAAGFFIALRDVTPMGETPPRAQEADIARYVAAGRVMADRIHGAMRYGDLELLQIELAERYEAAVIEREDMRRVWLKCKAEKHALQDQFEEQARRYIQLEAQSRKQRSLWQVFLAWWGSKRR